MADAPLIGAAWLKPDYRSALEKAGARIRELTPADTLPQALDDCDGLLLTGGVDVEPALYGQARHPTVETDEVRDEYEMNLARLALERDLPVLAICRGVQVLNVAAGGNLVQDIPSAVQTDLPHQITSPKNAIAHPVTIEGGTCLAGLLAKRLDASRTIDVNSRHHQSVDRVAPEFVVSATAPDGVVEAIEKPGAAFCVGVQWHPENFWQTGEFSDLFDGLVRAARRRP
ncbi:MAG TPA: gamma-glutamyl-gamma-aminobutyrate hydrolase family protein [Vicinamibacterales bacterium]|nr:gamma-glutamyl-gamma-aminobutyrate hydrolase family protein [Vicinamibacterales bacterium]